MMSENVLLRQSPFLCSTLQEQLTVHSFPAAIPVQVFVFGTLQQRLSGYLETH
jgi:hypothetical protein